jgi:hypothetical protein
MYNKKDILDMFCGPKMNPLKAMREYCLDCCGGSRKEVKLCPSTDCSLWPYRFGKNPYSTRVMSEEQREQARERMKAMLEAKRTANLRSE